MAGHLRERLREVDRREATLNARVAQLESDLRASRLWLSEREMAFQEREAGAVAASKKVQENAQVHHDQPETITIDSEAQIAELNEREHEVRLRREDDLRERRFEVDRQASAIRHAQQLWQHEREREEKQLTEQRRQFEADVKQWRQQFEQECAAVNQEREQKFDELIRQREEQLTAGAAILDEQSRAMERDHLAITTEQQAWD